MPHIQLGIYFSSFQEHLIIAAFTPGYITVITWVSFLDQGTPGDGNREPVCLTGLKRTFLLLIFLFPGLQHLGSTVDCLS